MKNKKVEKQRKKQAQNAKRIAARKIRPIATKIVKVYSTSDSMRQDFMEAVRRERDRIEEMFWEHFPGWYDPVKSHIRGGHKLSQKYIDYFTNISPMYFCDTIREVFLEAYPHYKAFNYGIEVYGLHKPKTPHLKLMTFAVELGVLETKSTKGGMIHMLPLVKFPANKPFGITTHAVGRMDTRVLDIHGDQQPIGDVLRCPLVFVPYKKNIYGMYMCIKPNPRCLYNGEQTPTYGLLGYLTVEEHKRHFIGVTHLAPGFVQTPEKKISDDKLSDYKMLTVIDGVVYRALAASPKASKHDRLDRINRVQRFDAVPYDLDHPNIHLIRGFEQFSYRSNLVKKEV